MEENKKIVLQETSLTINDVDIRIGMLFIYCQRVVEVVRFEEYNGYKKAICKSISYGEEAVSIHYLAEKDRFLSDRFDLAELTQMADQIQTGVLDPETLKVKSENTEQGLMVQNLDMVKNLKEKHTLAKVRVEFLKTIMAEKAEVARRAISDVLAVMNKQIQRLNNIIFTLELYAGVRESIKQIQSGAPATEEEPIYLNQSMRFMDEEVGDPSNGGISYTDIAQFDDWLLSRNSFLNCYHYEMLLPQKKSVRIMRVRRIMSEKWASDTWGNRYEIQQEMKTYILIRNGENIYTISSMMDFQEKLFPDLEEFSKIISEHDDTKRYDKLEKYKHGIILMQGLVDRTDVFGMVAGKINFLTLESQEKGDVVFQYEMESGLLTDGSKTFLDFINTQTLQHGDRILVYNAYQEEERLLRYYRNKYSMPDPPKDGIYKLEYDTKGKYFYIRYNPKDEVYSGWGYISAERKNNITYKINIERDMNLANFDAISNRDMAWLESMLYNRRDRRHYARANGLLKVMKAFKKIEQDEERPFLLMLIAHNKCTELEAEDLIFWWKTKNKHKRALTVDDQKAFRMINKKLEKDRQDGITG